MVITWKSPFFRSGQATVALAFSLEFVGFSAWAMRLAPGRRLKPKTQLKIRAQAFVVSRENV